MGALRRKGFTPLNDTGERLSVVYSFSNKIVLPERCLGRKGGGGFWILVLKCLSTDDGKIDEKSLCLFFEWQ